MTPQKSRVSLPKKVKRVTVLLPEHEYEAVRVVAESQGVERGPYLRSLCIKSVLRDFDRLLAATRSVR